MDAYLEPGGCEFFCEDCAPPGATAYPDGGGEADCPQHCAACHEPLGNPLTADGVAYVLGHVRDELRRPAAKRNSTATHWRPSEYYHGCTRTAVVRDWAEQLCWYGLDERDERLVGWYLEHSVSVAEVAQSERERG